MPPETVVNCSEAQLSTQKINFVKKKPVYKIAVDSLQIDYYIKIILNFHFLGDIVSVEDIDDGSVYYAQLRGFLTDQYCEKSGVITWLLPTVNR